MVRAIMIVEMAGKPAEHVKKKLSDHVMVLDKVKDAEIHSIKISEPQKVEDSKDVFTCFAEADFELPSFHRLTETVFDFMPSSVEVLDPGKITMDLAEATSFLNRVSGRMHYIDEMSKVSLLKLQEQQTRLQLARQLLLEHGIIDTSGKVVKKAKTKKAVKKKVSKGAKKKKTATKTKK